MKRGTRAVVLCLALACGLAHAQEAAKDASKPSPGVPKIRFEQTVYDFGKTSQVDHVTGTFVYQNVGYAPLKLEKPQPSCGCTIAALKPDVLQPGEKGELTFTLTMPKTRQILHKQITVLCNDPQAPRTLLTVKAEYVPLYDVSPAYVNVNVRKGQPTNVTVRVSRSDGKSFTLTNLKLYQTNSAGWIESKAAPEPNSTNGTVLITTTLRPEGNPRYFSELLNGYVDGSTQAVFGVTLYGRIMGDVTWNPEMIYWPITDASKAITNRPIVVRSALAEKLEIKNLTSTLNNIKLDAVSKDDGRTFEIQARLASIPERSTNGYIRFETNIPSQPRVDVPITIAVIKPPPMPLGAKPAQSQPAIRATPVPAPIKATQVPAIIDPTLVPVPARPAPPATAAASK